MSRSRVDRTDYDGLKALFAKAKFEVVELDTFHWRVGSGSLKVDFWPTTEKFYQPGTATPIKGQGIHNMIAAMVEHKSQPIEIPLRTVEGSVMEVCDLSDAEIVDTVAPNGSTSRKVSKAPAIVADALKLLTQSPDSLTRSDVMTLQTAVSFMANQMGVMA